MTGYIRFQQCEQHEFRDHLRGDIKCYVCNHKFSTTEALSKHMPLHVRLQRFACSFCHEWFTTLQELQQHWSTDGKICGRSMTAVRNAIAANAEKNFDVNNIRIKREPQDDFPTDFVPQEAYNLNIKTELPEHVEIKTEPVEQYEAKRKEHAKIAISPQVAVASSAGKRLLNGSSKATYNLTLKPNMKMLKLKELPTQLQTKVATTAAAKTTTTTNSNIISTASVPQEAHNLDIKTELPEHVEIKTEPVEQQEVKWKEHAEIALAPQVAVASSAGKWLLNGSKANYNLTLKPNIKMLKLKELPTQLQTKVATTAETTTAAAAAKTTTITNSNIISSPLQQTQSSSMQVLKSSLKAKIAKLPTTAHATMAATINGRGLTSEIKLLNTKLPATGDIKLVKLKAPDMLKLLESDRLKTPKAGVNGSPATVTIKSTPPAAVVHTKRLPVVKVSLVSLSKDTTIDECDLKKLMAEATRKADEGMSKLWLTKEVLEVIENLPEKRELIDNLMRRIKAVETQTAGNGNDAADTGAPPVHSSDVKAELFDDNSNECTKEEMRRIKGELDVEAMVPATNIMPSKSLDESNTQLLQHEKTHPRALISKWVCEKCDRGLSSKKMLADHLLANCGRNPQYDCTECPKKFFSKSTLNCHMSIHTGVLPHKCDFCEKRFRTRGQVTVHHRTHTGERPFACQVCSQSFTHRETLISHLSRHIGMKRYRCYACNKQFSCISGLKLHREKRPNTCAKVKFNSRAVGPRVRVVRGTVYFEPQPEINPYLRTEDPQDVLAEIQNQPTN